MPRFCVAGNQSCYFVAKNRQPSNRRFFSAEMALSLLTCTDIFHKILNQFLTIKVFSSSSSDFISPFHCNILIDRGPNESSVPFVDCWKSISYQILSEYSAFVLLRHAERTISLLSGS